MVQVRSDVHKFMRKVWPRRGYYDYCVTTSPGVAITHDLQSFSQEVHLVELQHKMPDPTRRVWPSRSNELGPLLDFFKSFPWTQARVLRSASENGVDWNKREIRSFFYVEAHDEKIYREWRLLAVDVRYFYHINRV
jgi:hypothetical protein